VLELTNGSTIRHAREIAGVENLQAATLRSFVGLD
jgi:hypothetical protein